MSPFHPARAAALGQTVPDASDLPMVVLGDIAQFAALRRQLGCRRAERLVVDCLARIADAEPGLSLVATGRTGFEGSCLGSVAVAEGLLAALKRLFAEPMVLDGERHLVALDLAVAVAAASSTDPVTLVEAAEAALAEARATGETVVRDLSRDDPTQDGRGLVRHLRTAIADDQLFLLYQPKAHLRRQEVAGVEALVRWQHPTRGLILPGEFIPAAEEAGEIGHLTLWTLRRVIADQRVLAAVGHDVPVFINMSGQLLADRAFVDQACALVAKGKARIGFEITETAMIRDPEGAIRHLERFAAIGIELAIDDYGAGLSSLAYLKQLPARELKIDKLFVTQLSSSNRDPLIVRSTIDLAHALEMEVTAEGVETPAALALLSVMGCDMVQGYLISRPITLDALLTFLKDGAVQHTMAHPRDLFLRSDKLRRVG